MSKAALARLREAAKPFMTEALSKHGSDLEADNCDDRYQVSFTMTVGEVRRLLSALDPDWRIKYNRGRLDRERDA